MRHPAAADVVAKLLADANAVGHDSHGVIRIPQYISTIEKGEIVPHAEVEVCARLPPRPCSTGTGDLAKW